MDHAIVQLKRPEVVPFIKFILKILNNDIIINVLPNFYTKVKFLLEFDLTTI